MSALKTVESQSTKPQSWRELPRPVIIFGLVSLLMDLSSETIHALLPLFMVSSLGLSVLSVSLLDSGAEALTLAIKPLAGWFSDRSSKRKPLIVAGYGLAALSKPLFALAGGLGLLLTARALDRFGKGLRGAPRDALIADVTAPEQRGAAYGLRQSLDTVGALLAPFAASLLLILSAENFRTVFWLASIPAFLAVLLLFTHIHEPARHHTSKAATMQSELALPLWPIFLLGALITLARPPEALLILRAQNIGFSLSSAPLILAVMNLFYAMCAFPLGRLYDRIGAALLLRVGLLLLVFSQLLLAYADTPMVCVLGALCWGLHLACSQGVIAALIAQRAPSNKRARAFGWYALCCGLALLANGSVTGLLWQSAGPAAAFLLTASIAGVGLILVTRLLKLH